MERKKTKVLGKNPQAQVTDSEEGLLRLICRWRELEEVTAPGPYLQMHKSELVGNASVIYIESHPKLGLITRAYMFKDVEKDVKAKIHCKGNKDCLFFGPIPFPPEG